MLDASFPPFSSRAFPLAIANADTWVQRLHTFHLNKMKINPHSAAETDAQLTCGRQSGRDSKMTSRTPMGTVICSSSRLLATLVRLSTRPTLSRDATASWRRPIARLFNLEVERLKRLIRGCGKKPKRTKDMADKPRENQRNPAN